MDVIVVIIVGAAIAVGVIVFLHFRKSKSVPQAVAATQADVMSVVSRLTDALHVANKTNQMNATVIASPPVQAVINTAPTPPTSAAVVPAAPAPVAPATPVAPFGTRDDGQPFSSQAEADAWHAAVAVRNANLAQWQAGFDKERCNGPVDVKSLTDAEKAFLLYAQEHYTLPGSELFSAVLSGSNADIGAAIAWADSHRGAPIDANRLAGYVDQYATGKLKPSYT